MHHRFKTHSLPSVSLWGAAVSVHLAYTVSNHVLSVLEKGSGDEVVKHKNWCW